MYCEYSIVSQFLSDEDIARLRIAKDIFIHAQKTDAFSETVQEYLMPEQSFLTQHGYGMMS
jgi:hypothetical protein